MLSKLFPGPGCYLGELFERAAALHPDLLVVLDHNLDVMPSVGRRLTVRDLANLVADLSARLWVAGIRPTEHVVVHKTHNFDIVLLALACFRVGAVPVLLSPEMDVNTVGALIARLDGPRLLTDRSTLDRLSAAIPETEAASATFVVAGDAPAATVDVGALVDAPVRAPVRLDAGQPAMITHTSGTTGLPKLVVHSTRTLWWRLVPQVLIANLIRGTETYAVCVSFVHSRLYSALGTALEHGMPLVVLADPDPANVAEVFVRTRPGLVETHPNCLVMWERLAEAEGEPLSSVRYYSSTFDAVHPGTIHRVLMASRRSRPVFAQLYGQSETGPISGRLYTHRWVPRADARCLGFPIPLFTRVRAVSRDGRQPTADSPGYLEVRTRGRALTYLGEEHRFARQADGAWWRLGDVGYLRRGQVHLLDRELDEIGAISSTLAVEDSLMTRLPELAEVVIVRGSDGAPIPVVSTRDDQPLDPNRWRRAVADLAPLAGLVQWPLAELPRTSTWKTERRTLAKLLRERGR